MFLLAFLVKFDQPGANKVARLHVWRVSVTQDLIGLKGHDRPVIIACHNRVIIFSLIIFIRPYVPGFGFSKKSLYW